MSIHYICNVVQSEQCKILIHYGTFGKTHIGTQTNKYNNIFTIKIYFIILAIAE